MCVISSWCQHLDHPPPPLLAERLCSVWWFIVIAKTKSSKCIRSRLYHSLSGHVFLAPTSLWLLILISNCSMAVAKMLSYDFYFEHIVTKHVLIIGYDWDNALWEMCYEKIIDEDDCCYGFFALTWLLRFKLRLESILFIQRFTPFTSNVSHISYN